MSLEQIIALFAMLAALGATFWAWSSARTARQALFIAKEEASSRREQIKPYLITSLRWREENGNIYVSFACSYTNSSSYPNTISRLELIIHAFTLSGRVEKVILTSVQNTPVNSNFSLLPVPLNLKAMSTISGWLTFQLPTSLGELLIDKYEISATTATGGRITLDSYHILEKEIENEC